MQTISAIEAPSAKATVLDDDTFLTSRATRAQVGDPTNMTLWRWQRDPRVRFPPPDAVINNRRYWRVGTIRRWQAERIAQQAA